MILHYCLEMYLKRKEYRNFIRKMWFCRIMQPKMSCFKRGWGVHLTSNLHLGVVHSVLWKMEGVGHVFSNHHIFKCSGPLSLVSFLTSPLVRWGWRERMCTWEKIRPQQGHWIGARGRYKLLWIPSCAIVRHKACQEHVRQTWSRENAKNGCFLRIFSWLRNRTQHEVCQNWMN